MDRTSSPKVLPTQPTEKPSQQTPNRTTAKTPPSTNPETGPFLKEPSEAVLNRLDTLTSRRDAAGLLALARSDHSLVRYEALQQHLDLIGPEGLPDLLFLLQQDPDPALHQLLQEAIAAGGNTAIAESLSRNLTNLPTDSARLAASLGILGIGERESISTSTRNTAIDTLESLTRNDPDLASEACDGLSECGTAGLDCLERMAKDQDIEEASRLTAAEALHRKQPQRARRHLEELAQDGNDPDVRQMARLYLEQSDGE
jgi:hypothetical protein